MVTLMQTSTAGPDAAAAAGVMAAVGGFWCCAMSLGVGQFVMALVALIQVLNRQPMSGTDKLLWGLISWFIPIIGPILWWVIGNKQYPARPPGGPPAGPGQY